MITIPIWQLMAAMLAGCSVGVLAATLSAASGFTRQAKRLEAVRRDLRNDRDATRDRLRVTQKRLKECEAVMAEIRRLLPPEIDATTTSS